MESNHNAWPMLDLMRQAAFRVENGIITYVNPIAARYLFLPGMQIRELLASGMEEYQEFTDGYLYLSLTMQDFLFGATVVRMDGGDVFLLEEQQEDQQFQALALAAMKLRTPLAGIISAAHHMFPLVTENASPEVSQYAAQINQRLMQLQRIVSNMSDSNADCQADPRNRELIEIVSTLEEQLSRAAQALAHAGIRLEYQLLQERIYTLVYAERLERTVYNLLSNAAKASAANSVIRVQLTKQGNRLALSVMDSGTGIRDKGDIFTHYLRQPGLEDNSNGIGLGMVLIRSTAMLHGGAVLVDCPEGAGTRVTITMAITQPKDTSVRSPRLRIDYAGEQDHCLLELSDVLPNELYAVDTIP